MANATVSLAQLIADNPHLARELAKLLTKSELHTKRNVSKYASMVDYRATGAAMVRIIRRLTEETADVFEREGVTLGNQWRLNAVGSAAKEIFPAAREALGIAPLRAIGDSPARQRSADWRRSLVEVEAQIATPPPVDQREGQDSR